MRLFSKIINKSISYVVSACIAITSVPVTSSSAIAAPTCTNAYAADSGTDKNCAGVKIGGVTVAYPKLQWTKVGEVGATPMQSDAGELADGDEGLNLANRAASALGIGAVDVASMVNLFPSNVPYVFARYNPLESELRIDIFKLEKTFVNGQKKTGLYHATFAPQHGNLWKASRSYIHPDALKAGTSPGVNPFVRFQSGTSDIFHEISVNGAQVAIGHAMRYVGAPFGLLAYTETRFSQVKKKSGNAFRKKVTITTYGHAKPKWFIAQPVQFQDNSSTYPLAKMCAPDPDAEECPLYQTATAGVTFEEFSGGTLSDYEDAWQVDKQSQSGWGFLAVLIVAVIGSFVMAGVLSAVGLGGAATGAGAGASAGATGASAGMFGSMLINQGIITGFSSIYTSVAVEAAFIAAKWAVLGGANLSSMMTMGPETFLGYSSVVKGTADAPDLDKIQKKLNYQVSPRTTSNFAQGESTITGFERTVTGGCAPGTALANCGGGSGIVPRADQYDEFNSVQFMRDTEGEVIRDDTKWATP